ncbi:MAG: carbon storage regulator CsrA [Deltaproteobacteria bacterium]|nr:carbon storage regulator CsrA [Deltaproteobacteria bacterium]
MLILTRKPGESLYIGDNVKITIVEIKGHQIRVGIDAPSDLRIYREEIYLQILEENKKAAEAPGAADSGLEGLSSAWAGRKQPELGGGKRSISALSSAKPQATEPQVFIKRKRGKDSDEGKE